MLRTLRKNKEVKDLNNHHQNLITNYRFQISDLKDEIEVWKERYKNKKKIRVL